LCNSVQAFHNSSHDPCVLLPPTTGVLMVGSGASQRPQEVIHVPYETAVYLRKHGMEVKEHISRCEWSSWGEAVVWILLN
jgi:hypothetical protein